MGCLADLDHLIFNESRLVLRVFLLGLQERLFDCVKCLHHFVYVFFALIRAKSQELGLGWCNYAEWDHLGALLHQKLLVFCLEELGFVTVFYFCYLLAEVLYICDVFLDLAINLCQRVYGVYECLSGLGIILNLLKFLKQIFARSLNLIIQRLLKCIQRILILNHILVWREDLVQFVPIHINFRKASSLWLHRYLPVQAEGYLL